MYTTKVELEDSEFYFVSWENMAFYEMHTLPVGVVKDIGTFS
jgi:hypothetical protein